MRRLSRILGIGVDRLDTEGTLQRIEEFISDGKSHQIAYVNAHCLNCIFCDKEYKEIVSGSDLVYPDGMVVVWASYFYGEGLPERVNLGDFLPSLCRLCVKKGYRLFLLGGEDGIAKKTGLRLKEQFPSLEIAGTYHGFFDQHEEESVINKINSSSVDILLVGMGTPKQEKWIAKNRDRLKVSILWGVGALFNYYAGQMPRAPILMRKAGLEWLFRLFIEPGRLWKRYIVGNLIFSLRLFFPVIIDIVLVAFAWVAAYWLRYSINPLFKIPIGSFKNYIYMLPLMVLTWPFICNFFGLYRIRRSPGQIAQLADMLKTVSAGLILAVTFSFIFREIGIARSFLALWAIINLFSLIISRRILKHLNFWLFQDIDTANVMIVGTDDSSLALKRELENSQGRCNIAGFLKAPNAVNEKADSSKKILGEFGELEDVIQKHGINEVILSDERMALSEKLNLVTKYLNSEINFKIISKELQPFSERVRLEELHSKPMLEVSFREAPLMYLMFKGLIDRAAALFAIIVAMPLWAIIALIIKADSPGPAIFVQTRVGRTGRNFRLYKFRTMSKDTPADEAAPLRKDDVRITRAGRFLRRWSLDELPQLLNVLKGDMSLVGPRPEMPFIVSNYEPWQRQRLKVKPGITGLWQVAGRKDIPLHKNIEYDFYYINNRSFMLDLAIILKSIPAIVLRKGAY